jgi:hypothetical protein
MCRAFVCIEVGIIEDDFARRFFRALMEASLLNRARFTGFHADDVSFFTADLETQRGRV